MLNYDDSKQFIELGVSLYASEIDPSKSDDVNLKQIVPISLLTHIKYIEYKVNSLEEIDNIREIVEGSDRYCVIHAPDIQTDDWTDIIFELSKIQNIRLINVHARPDDVFTLCQSCCRRIVNLNTTLQICDYCGELLNEYQVPPLVCNNDQKTIVDKLNAASHILEKKNIRLSVENTYEPPYLLKQILDQVPANVGFTLDVGHTLLYHPFTTDYIYVLRDRLCHLHLHDNMGGNSERYHDVHIAPGQGIANWTVISKALNKIGYDQTATLECQPDALQTDFLFGLLNAIYLKTEELKGGTNG